MRFEKATLGIICKKSGEAVHVKTVIGYLFEAAFSDGTIHRVGVYKRSAYNKTVKGMAAWCVTCYQTGRAICEGDTREQAVRFFIDYQLPRYERYRQSARYLEDKRLFDSVLESVRF